MAQSKGQPASQRWVSPSSPQAYIPGHNLHRVDAVEPHHCSVFGKLGDRGRARLGLATQNGSVSAGHIEWVPLDKGVCHAASAVGETNLVGYQIWMLLPPEEALAPPYSRHFDGAELPVHDGVRVIFGSWEKRKGPVRYDNAATLLGVRRKADEGFAFTIEAGHQLA